MSSDKQLAQCLKYWCKNQNIIFSWERLPGNNSKLQIIKYFLTKSINILSPVSSLFAYIISIWPLRGLGVEEWKDTNGEITFVSYFDNLNSESIKKGEFKSHYWGHLPNEIHMSDIKTNWLHLYVKDNVLPTAKHAANAITLFNKDSKGNQVHSTIESFLDWQIIKNTILDWASLFIKGKKLLKVTFSEKYNQIIFWPSIQSDLKKSIFSETALINLLYYNLFNKAIKLLKHQQKGLYLQENQGWEFALIQVWEKASHGELIGVPHSTIRYWDMRYYFDSRHYNDYDTKRIPRPNMVAVNGKFAKNCLIQSGYPKDELIEVDALRYLYLNKYKN